MLSNTQRDWNAELQTLEGHSDIVTSAAFSPGGQLLASGLRNFLQHSDQAFLVWDTSTGALKPQSFESHSNSVCSVASRPTVSSWRLYPTKLFSSGMWRRGRCSGR